MITFDNLIKEEKIQKAIKQIGYETPTEIQAKAIPIILERRDIIAKSNTGTGKTAAFGLPLIQLILQREVQKAMILCPTRELAMQVEDELKKYAKGIDAIHLISVYGGAPIDRQIRALKKGANIVVGTPGRVLDHIKRKTIRMDQFNYMVLDEADEMLNMGFRDDIEMVLNQIHQAHQTILFSATMPKAIREIASSYLSDKVEIEVKSKERTVSNIDQSYVFMQRGDRKNDVIKKLIEFIQPSLTIIFCNTKAKVDELVDELSRKNVRAMALHGDIKQEKRTKIMASFKQANKAILVASDVAARGIDVNNIDLVINYDLPQDNEIYVHRIGRTGRAGNTGRSISLVQGKKQQNQINQIMRFTKADIKEIKLPSVDDLKHAAKNNLIQQVESKIKDEGIMFGNIQAANELVKKGYDPQEIISALFSLVNGTSLPSDEPMKKKRKIKHAVQLRFSIGKAKRITIGEIEQAIERDTGLTKDKLGTIDLRKHYTIVEVNKDDADTIIKTMNPTYIKKQTFEVYYYKKEKSASR